MPFTNPKNLLEANMNNEKLDAAFENIRHYAENGEDMWESTHEDTSAEPEGDNSTTPTDNDYLDALYEKISE